MSQPNEPNIRARRVYADREADAIAALTLAFSADPANRWCWPTAGEYLDAFPAFVRALGGRAFAGESAFEIADCAGIALWLPPGIEPDEAELMTVIQRTVDRSRQDALYMLVEQMGRHHPAVPHWYLPFVGVEPQQQGRGLGALVLRPILQRCDSQRLPAYLESTNPRNIPFYERLGFRRAGRLQAGTSPVIVPMIREPQP